MPSVRLPWYGAALVALLLVGYGLALFGLGACAPPPLPGEAAWAWKLWAGQAFGVVLGAEPRCFLEAGAGAPALRLASWTDFAMLVFFLAALLLETAGREALRGWRRRRGGHNILAGEPGEIEALARRAGRRGRVLVGRTPAAARIIARRFPLADTTALGDRAAARTLLRRLGAAQARLVAATTANDLANGELAEAALDLGGAGDILVRFEQSGVRGLKSDGLRHQAEGAGRQLTVVSLRQMQARAALGLAMPGRFVTMGAARTHLALCGAGPAMQEMAFLLARQGYGLERAPPVFSLLRTGRSDFTVGALERLASAGAAEIRAGTADGHDALVIDREFAAVALGPEPLAAVFCCEEEEGSAAALALRLERVLCDLDRPVPPIVVLGHLSGAPSLSGMIRPAPEPSLAEAAERAALLDRRALEFHAAYARGQRKAQGQKFGALPAERLWSELPEALREDNRHAADHVDYKLARIGFVPAEGEGRAVPDAAEIEMLAAVEHARWMAARQVAGWRFGKPRDDSRLLHPDLKPFDALDADAKRKDREQVASVLDQLGRAGIGLARLVLHEAEQGTDARTFLAGLAQGAETDRSSRPLVSVAWEAEADVALAEAVLARGLAVEIRMAPGARPFFRQAGLRPRAAAVLREAWRIRVPEPATAGEGQEMGRMSDVVA